LLKAGLLAEESFKTHTKLDRVRARRDWMELRLTKIFGPWAQGESHRLASALYRVDVLEG